MIYRYEGQMKVDNGIYAKVTIPGREETREIPVELTAEDAVPGDDIHIRGKIEDSPTAKMFLDRIEETPYDFPADELAVCFFPEGAQNNRLVIPAATIPRAKEGRWYRCIFVFDQEKTEAERERIQELQDELIEKPEDEK